MGVVRAKRLLVTQGASVTFTKDFESWPNAGCDWYVRYSALLTELINSASEGVPAGALSHQGFEAGVRTDARFARGR